MLKKNYFLYIIFAVLLALQPPFLHADPDAALTNSRDAATDEGIYSSQVRNYINNDVLSFSNIDCILKAMLFSGLLFVSLSAFGTTLLAARLTVLLLSFLVLFFLSRNKKFRETGVVFMLIAFTNYYVFQYAHFAMAEMLSIVSICAGIFFIFKSVDDDQSAAKHIFLSSLFFALSYYLKIQFVYAAVILPVVFLVAALVMNGNKKNFLLAVGFTSLWMLLYYLGWYLPFKEIHQQLMTGQEVRHIVIFHKSAIPVLKDNIKYIMFSAVNTPMSIAYIGSFLVGVYFFFKTDNRVFRMLFIASNVWVAVESHKWFMTYLPSRYLVSLYAAELFVIAVVLSELLKTTAVGWKCFAYICIAGLLVSNTFRYARAYNNREFVIKEANEYLSKYDLKNETALGSWAGSFTWDCKMFSLPVWNNFLNYREPLKTYNPRIVIAEHDEADSGHAFTGAGINLKEASDSSRSFLVRKRWNVIVYWMKPASQ